MVYYILARDVQREDLPFDEAQFKVYNPRVATLTTLERPLGSAAGERATRVVLRPAACR